MSMKTGPAIGAPDLVGAPENSALCPPTNVLLSSLTWNLRPHSGQCRKKSICDQPSRRESKCFSDHSCPQCLHLYEYWNSSMSTTIGLLLSSTSRRGTPRNWLILNGPSFPCVDSLSR